MLQTSIYIMSNLFNQFPPPPRSRTPLLPRTPYPPRTPHPNTNLRQNVKTTTQSARSPLLPRVGGIEDGIVWTGGSRNDPTNAPRDVRCYRPTDFRSMQEQDKVLKKGVADDLKLTLIDENDNKDNNQTVSGWIDEIKFLIETNGMDSVFRIDNGITPENYMLMNWGNIKLFDVTNWVKRLKQYGCPFDLKNLRLSGMLIRDSISTKVKQQISATTSIADISGPELLVYAIQQRTIMSAAHIRTLSNKLGSLSLGDIPGERVPDLTKSISDIARQLVGSGREPDDLINLISKPYTKGSVDIFKMYALGTHAGILSGAYPCTWENLVSDHNNMYYDLVQTDDYPPTTGKKQKRR